MSDAPEVQAQDAQIDQGQVSQDLVRQLVGLNRFGEEFVASWSRCEPETVAQWMEEGTLQQRAHAAQEAMQDTIVDLVAQGLTHFEAVHQASRQHLQPPQMPDED
jgi:hypothetical protein